MTMIRDIVSSFSELGRALSLGMCKGRERLPWELIN